MFNRQLAVTFVKRPKKDATAESAMDTTMLTDISENLVNTAAGLGVVVVVTATALTGLRVAEHVTKYLLR